MRLDRRSPDAIYADLSEAHSKTSEWRERLSRVGALRGPFVSVHAVAVGCDSWARNRSKQPLELLRFPGMGGDAKLSVAANFVN